MKKLRIWVYDFQRVLLISMWGLLSISWAITILNIILKKDYLAIAYIIIIGLWLVNVILLIISMQRKTMLLSIERDIENAFGRDWEVEIEKLNVS